MGPEERGRAMAHDSQTRQINSGEIKPRVSFEKILWHFDLWDNYGFKKKGNKLTGPCPICLRGRLKINTLKNTFFCTACKKRGSVVDFCSALKGISSKETDLLLKDLLKQTPSFGQSVIFQEAGIPVPFYDVNTATAFDQTVRVCKKMGIPFDRGYNVLYRKWLSDYIKRIKRELRSHGVTQGTKRILPPEDQIETWIREEIK